MAKALESAEDKARRRSVSGARDVTEGVIWVQLLQLCLPIFLSSFFQQSYSLINTFVVGQFAGKEPLGGIQATAALTELAVGFCVGVGSGCAVVAGQYFGARDDRNLAKAVHTAMTLAILAGIVVSVVFLLAIGPILRLMGTPAELLDDSLAYGRCYFGATVFSLVFNMGSGLLRAVGDTRTPSLVVAGTCVANMLLDLVFVAALDLGALGCGIATACSLALGAGVTLWHLCHVRGAWRVDLRRLGIDGHVCRLMLLTGIPLGLQSSSYSISNMVVQSSINSFGADTVTSWGLSGRIDGIVWLVSDALAIAVMTFAAQNFGAGNYRRMRECLKVGNLLTFLLVVGIAAVLMAFVEPISLFFVDDAAIAALTTTMMRFIAPFYVCYSILNNISGVIRGAGESLRPMIITVVGTVVFRVLWVLLFVPTHHTLHTVLLSYPVTWLITLTIFVTYYYRGHWLQHAQDKERAVLSA